MRSARAKMRAYVSTLRPVQRALLATAWFAAVGVVFHYLIQIGETEPVGWSLVTISPLFGVATYLDATGRDPYLASVMLGLGIGGVLFWTLAVLSGGLPVKSAGDVLAVAFIVAIPIASIGFGVEKLRRRRKSETGALS